ncbi:hypothetical protein [Pseudogemmobacter sonorensis]|uniref:hypothetical protein n=1 Tax=Pseudogemmobacter sonorensis TaxID=2989681 RepID=UPI0036A3DA11
MVNMDKVRNAFRTGIILNDEETAVLVAEMSKQGKRAKERRQRNERIGENYGIPIPQYRPKIPNWMKRKLTRAEIAQLAAGWDK